jgi:hypothetical protein
MRILLFIWLCCSRASGCNAGHYGCLCDAWLWYEHELTDALFACYADDTNVWRQKKKRHRYDSNVRVRRQ